MQKPTISFDSTSFTINGKREFLHSADFHYFRVPKNDWKRRLDLFKATGGNCIGTYVPWIVHEPTDGNIVFGDCDERDLAGFLELAKEMRLSVILRPGPYQYSEMVCSGIPSWLYTKYPQVMARDCNGRIFCNESFSYLHPLFMQRVERYLTAVIDIARPYLVQNDGTVCMIQLDNELIGAHSWHGSIDYNADTMGFGKDDGRYTLYLKNKYGSIKKLNQSYGDKCSRFSDVMPNEFLGDNIQSARKKQDYLDFYLETCAEYGEFLLGIYEKNGVQCPLVHNATNTADVPLTCMKKFCSRQRKDFLLGVDSYYTLGIPAEQNNVTPQYYLKQMFCCDLLRAMKMPPTLFELGGGSPADVPPILKEDILTCYMSNLSLGYKGFNYYVFTGGANFPNTSFTSDTYDFNAFIRSDGSKNDTYESLIKFGDFLRSHEWISQVERSSSVQVGVEWGQFHSPELTELKENHKNSIMSTENGVMLSLLYSQYSGRYVVLTENLDKKQPLIVVTSDVMSKRAQQNIVDFISGGGNAIIFGCLPSLDEYLDECTILRDEIGVHGYGEVPDLIMYAQICGELIYRYDMPFKRYLSDIPTGAEIIGKVGDCELAVGIEKNVGKGRIIYFCNEFYLKTFQSVKMLEHLLENIDALPIVKSTNRHIFTQLYTDGVRSGAFVLNLYTGAQRTDLTIYLENKTFDLSNVELEPMEVKWIDIET